MLKTTILITGNMKNVTSYDSKELVLAFFFLFLLTACSLDTKYSYQAKSKSSVTVSGKQIVNNHSSSSGSGEAVIDIDIKSNEQIGDSARGTDDKAVKTEIAKNQYSNSSKGNGSAEEYRTTTVVNLRSGPNSSDMKICTLAKDKTVHFTGIKNGIWWQVEVDEKKGWIHSSYIKKKTSGFLNRFKNISKKLFK